MEERMNYTASDEARFWSKVNKGEGCWEWDASTFDDGYGCFWAGKRNHRAHRVSYELLVGAIPDGMMLDHRCFNHACVNPDHLRPATVKQNGEHRQGPQANNKTGVRGVFKRHNRDTYAGIVIHNQKRVWVGTFATVAEAEVAVIAKRKELFTHNDLDRAA